MSSTEILQTAEYVTDANGNRATVKYWGSEKVARESLAMLTDCKDCTDCSNCSRSSSIFPFPT